MFSLTSDSHMHVLSLVDEPSHRKFPKKFNQPFLEYLMAKKNFVVRFSQARTHNSSNGPSINDVSSKGEGGGVRNVGIYLVKRRQKGREGVIKSEKWMAHKYLLPISSAY